MASIKGLRNIKQAFYHYEKWEDYQSGMYNPANDEAMINKAVEMLSDETLCREHMERVVSEWPIATAEVLTNPESNGRAWLGQCACFMYAGCHDEETRKAWVLLKPSTQKKANGIADKVIKAWLTEYSKRCPDYQLNVADLGVEL